MNASRDGLPWRRWLGRVTLGGGYPIPSRQRSALELEGYLSPRWLLGVEGGPYVGEQLVIAAFALTSLRYDSSSFGGPTLREDVNAFGLSVPFVVPLRVDAIALLTPRLGIGFGSQSFGSKHEYSTGPAWGFDACVLMQRAHFGFGVGFWSLRAPARGAAESNDYGSLLALLNFGVGR
ncbi:MAG TPA: hypothetical protein VFQ35_06265 [Polyangiaceae bacterium]|nr:hypothetical protein [Polyangiaceae bacterium]